MSSINRYTDLQLSYGPKFNQLNVTQPSVISTVNDVTGIGVSDGDRYIVGSSPTDDFLLANTNDIAYYDGTIGEWVFTTPYVGQELIDRDSKTLKRYNGTNWIDVFTFVSPSGTSDINISGNATTATRWETTRSIRIENGGWAGPVAIDGTSNILLQLGDLDMSYATRGILDVARGGTGRTDNKTVGLINPIQIQLSNGLSGNTESTDLSGGNNVVINVTAIDADFINSGNIGVKRGGTGTNVLNGILKGNGTNAVTTAIPGTDYALPTSSITGNAGSADKFSSKKTIAVIGDMSGTVSTDFGDDTVITTAYAGTVPVKRGGTGQTTLTVNKLLKGNGTDPVTYATPGVDYIIPSGNIAGNSGSADKFSSARSVTINGAVVGSASSIFSTSNQPTITTTYNDVVPINKGGTGATSGYDAVKNIGAAYLNHTHPQSDITGLADILAQVVPAGAFSWFCGSTVPSGYLECNGAAISRTTYAKLFAVIGTTYGSGDGSTTFNIPDTRGMFVRGWNHGKLIGNSSLSADKLDGYDRAIGSTQLAASPEHEHSYSGTVSTNGDHTHTGSTTTNGNHAHTVSISGNGEHLHNVAARTGTNGNHTHGYWDVFFNEVPTYNKWGLSQVSVPYNFGSNGGYDNDDVGFQMARTTDPAGGHWHDVSGTAQSAGYHSHIGTCVDSGAHSHSINIVSNGNHIHTFSGDTTALKFESNTSSYLTSTRIDNRPMNIAFMGIIKY